MVPLNWNGSAWVDATEENWVYNYDTVADVVSNGTVTGNGSGQWANARLADGSIYVWIPRYSYKILGGENRNVITWNADGASGDDFGKIDIRWSSGITDFVSGGYIAHPAFNYAQYLGGDTSDPDNYNTSTTGGVTPLTDADKLEGFWVAKYEASQADSQLLRIVSSTGISTQRYEQPGAVVDVTASGLTGYEFVNWEATGVTLLNTTNPNISFVMPNNPVTLTANIAMDTSTVTFESNGGSAVSAISVITSEAYETLPTPTKNGYVFDGWYKDTGLTNKVTASDVVTDDHTLYAKWTAAPYTVILNNAKNQIYNLNDVGATTSDCMTYSVSNGRVTVTANTDDGWGFINARADLVAGVEYTFTCSHSGEWDTWNSNNYGVQAWWLLDGQWGAWHHMESDTYTFTPTVTGTYWLRLDVNVQGETHTFWDIYIAEASNMTATYGSAMPTITVPNKMGYIFGGYYTKPNGGGTCYYNSNGTSAKNYDIISNTTLYAKWTVNTYTVMLDQQSGSGGSTSVTATYASAMPAITKPTRSGYTFGGYYTSTGGSGTQYYNADGSSARNFDLTSATTLYAKWTANGAPAYTYTGSASKSKDSTYWYITFTSGGTFKFTSESPKVDVFCVGGGGGGGGVEGTGSGGKHHGGCGGGGYASTKTGVTITAGTSYTITIGSGGSGGGYDATGGRGGTTSAFGHSANGGYGGTGGEAYGTPGGAGGCGGGGGRSGSSNGTGGTGGGANGGSGNASANTGGGGGGVNGDGTTGGAGGSGIVIIRGRI